ncbi:MAG: hypothetical protein EOP83_09835 [Verrucomicrobiaceae bacterium]|nr:MAG: hypothetical protein EOP83_09835 [Verrucomicrobiaceae bacterium]
MAGSFRLELNTFETKMFDLGKTFSDNVGEVKIDFARKTITVHVKDTVKGEVFAFLEKISEDEKRVLRIKYGDPVTYTIEFFGTEIKSHSFDMGDAFETGKAVALMNQQFGISYNQSPMEHKIVFSFKDKTVK